MAIKAISTNASALRQWPEPGQWTYDDYKALPNDGHRYEVIWGELYLMSPAPTTKHQRISRNLEFTMWDYVQQHNLGEIFDAPCDVLLPKGGTPVQPDIIFIAQANLHLIEEAKIAGVPDLLVEILSSDVYHDRVTKFQLYAQAGVPEYWLIDPVSETIEVFHLQGGQYQLLGKFVGDDEAYSTVITGFRVEVKTIIY